jgi:hypothetical protein
MSNLFKSTPRQARKFAIECIQAGLVPYIQGSPGIGKSSIVRGIAQDFELKLIDHRLSTSEPTDMTGIPRSFLDAEKRERSRFAPFELPLNSKGEPMGGWLLFLDEANAAPRSVQVAAYKLVLDRMVGQHNLHQNVAMVMAGNLATDRAIVNPLSTAMQSRLIHLELQVNFVEWLEDVALKEHYDPRIIAFLSQWESKLMDFKPDHHEHTFCCPRTWEFVNRLISTLNEDGTRTSKPITDDHKILLTGAITSGVAMEFVKFTEVYANLISVTQILADPKGCPLPADLNLRWAVITHMMEKIDAKNFEGLATYADRFDSTFRILFYRSILVRKPALRLHPKFGSHISKISQYLHGHNLP